MINITRLFYILFFSFYFSLIFIKAEVWVYPGAEENLKSNKYYVRILQDDNVYESFVYHSKNTNDNITQQLSTNNHWTSFSFNDEITVEITKLFGNPVRFCIIRPKETRLKPEVSGHVIKIKLTKPQKLYLEINEAEEEPLFIFADTSENNVPDISNNSVLYYGPGVHTIGTGYEVTNKDIYIAGGAYIIGSFHINSNRPVNITGRGIISGYSQNNGNKRNDLIRVNGEPGKVTVDGITFTDAIDYCISTNQTCHVLNSKFFGWSNNSKGINIGDSSKIDNCFFKVDNDIITIHHSNLNISNCIIWQQANGAPFQFTSYEKRMIENIEIKKTNIIRTDISEDSIWTSDKTIFNCRELSHSVIKNIFVEDLRVEGNVHRLLGINTGIGGEIKGFTFKDVKIEGVFSHENYISAMNGAISNILFDNVEANYMKITNEYDAYIEKRGNVANIQFKWKNY